MQALRMLPLTAALAGIIVLPVQAGTLAQCQFAEEEESAVASCVEAAQHRSSNRLREASIQLLDTTHRKVRETGSKTLLRQFRTAEARHVRQRSRACSRQPAGMARSACEVDMNLSHIDRMKQRFAQ